MNYVRNLKNALRSFQKLRMLIQPEIYIKGGNSYV